MHDNTLVFPLALSWLRYYPGDLFSEFYVDYGISNKTKNVTKYMDFLDRKFNASDCAAVLCSLLRLGLLRFSNLWANLDLESRQQLTHTHIHIHNAPIC